MLYGKPVKDWDFEELQKGRTRDPETGKFRMGPKPKWITDIVMGEVQKRLELMTRQELAGHTKTALGAIRMLLTDDREDENGRPFTSSATKLAAATYVLDQIIGKPTTRVQVDASVNVNNFLAKVMVNPDGEDAHPVIEGEVAEEEVEDDDE